MNLFSSQALLIYKYRGKFTYKFIKFAFNSFESHKLVNLGSWLIPHDHHTIIIKHNFYWGN